MINERCWSNVKGAPLCIMTIIERCSTSHNEKWKVLRKGSGTLPYRLHSFEVVMAILGHSIAQGSKYNKQTIDFIPKSSDQQNQQTPTNSQVARYNIRSAASILRYKTKIINSHKQQRHDEFSIHSPVNEICCRSKEGTSRGMLNECRVSDINEFDNHVVELSATPWLYFWYCLHTTPCCCTLMYKINNIVILY